MAGMIVGEFVHADLDLSGAATFLNLYTKSGNEYAINRFKTPVDTPERLLSIQEPIIKIRKQIRRNKNLEVDINSLFKEISGCEKSVDEIINFRTVDPRIAETTDQVFWKPGTFGCFINGWGSVIEFILFWKTIFMPSFAVLMPFLVIILPYILLRTMFGLDIAVADYVRVLQRMALNNTPLGNNESSFAMLAKYAYILMSGGVFISNIWNQIQSAIHLRSVASDIRENGGHILTYVKSCKELATLLGDNVGIATADAVNLNYDMFQLGAYGTMYNNSKSLARLRDWVSEIDLEIGVARLKGICFPKALAKNGEFILNINALYHPGVPFGKRVMNSVQFGPNNNNMLVTGPNRGGKSTLCKSIGFAVMCAQSWGFAWAKSMNFVPVSRFETALAPADTLGRLSLFEAEIEFAKHLLAISEKAKADKEEAPCLIIMDEIFHSTNAHDGAEASLIFLKQLYEKGGNSIGSIISTHYRELPDKLTGVKTYCMEAFDGKDGLKYTYRCVPGISTISSVREILKERGLLPMETSVPSTISDEHP
jgi:hypothetical protein